MDYVGRFAPSPTGPLHFGSLVAALASYLDARHAGGKWLLRIEDLDPPRESVEAPAQIIDQLTKLGLIWDGDVFFQGNRDFAYQTTLTRLADRHLIYPCTCSRKNTPAVYQGICRQKTFDTQTTPFAIRLRLRDGQVSMTDRVFGDLNWDLKDDVGDFIIKRKDGLFAYQLAVVVDDHEQGINHVVRGADLLDSTPRQLALYEALRYPPPKFLHIPILVDNDGNKLSKQSHARPVTTEDPLASLRAALQELGQDPQTSSQSTAELVDRAVKQWLPERIPRQLEKPAPLAFL